MQLLLPEPCGFLGLLALLAPLRSSLGGCRIAALPKFRYSDPLPTRLPVSVSNRDYIAFKCKANATKIPGRRDILVCCGNSWGSPEDPCGRSCPLPPVVRGAKKKVSAELQYFPVGIVVKYDCTVGYGHVPNTKNYVHCGSNLKWSQPEEFCKVSCPLPPRVNGAKLKREFQHLKYFPPGFVVKYDCSQGFRYDPTTDNSVRCDNLRWTAPEVFCKESCALPPVLKNAILKEDFRRKEYFPPRSIAVYECVAGYAQLPGTNNFILCGDDFKWSFLQPFCKASCRLPPIPMGTKLKAEFENLASFFPGMKVKYDCIGGHKAVPGVDNSVSCGNNLKWSQPQKFCKVSCPPPPFVRNAVLKREFQKSVYFIGDVIEYECVQGYQQFTGTDNSLRCGDQGAWFLPGDFCRVGCGSPPTLTGAKLKRRFWGLKYFSIGSIVEYECDKGYILIPGTVNSIHCSSGSQWSSPIEFCKVTECDDPVIEHGVKLSGFRNVHLYGNDITFECNIGYFMIGSFLIHCGENNMWKPRLPSCEKINPKLCGTPSVPSGSFHPTQPQYEIGEFVTIQCNPQYSFLDETMEMTTVCQGNNFWKPPIQLCLFGFIHCKKTEMIVNGIILQGVHLKKILVETSSDASVLTIPHGRIINGKKKIYKPGDTITVQCVAGFTLQGPSVIRYIGGKKWIPKIPYCSLSIFFILLISGQFCAGSGSLDLLAILMECFV